MILTLDDVSVDIGPAQYPQAPNTELVQAVDKSATGVTYVEDFSLEIGTITYSFVDMRVEEYILLLEFFVNTAQGQLNTFTLTTDRNESKTVRFNTPRIGFTETFLDLWSGSFTVEYQQ